MGFAQAGRREQISAIYRYSNSVGGDPVSESTFCYKLYSVFLMGSSTGRDVIYDPHLRKARTLAVIFLGPLLIMNDTLKYAASFNKKYYPAAE